MAISIHALREEGDFGVGREDAGCPDFYPRPPRGGRHVAEALFPEGLKISIHALREEGDIPAPRFPTRSSNFYPRPPRGGRLRSW